jgi:hypothetical protein
MYVSPRSHRSSAPQAPIPSHGRTRGTEQWSRREHADTLQESTSPEPGTFTLGREQLPWKLQCSVTPDRAVRSRGSLERKPRRICFETVAPGGMETAQHQGPSKPLFLSPIRVDHRYADQYPQKWDYRLRCCRFRAAGNAGPAVSRDSDRPHHLRARRQRKSNPAAQETRARQPAAPA